VDVILAQFLQWGDPAMPRRRGWEDTLEAFMTQRPALLREVGCDALADRRLATCSLGERQRVLLARALFGDHELLLFDEPAAGLDLPGREALLAAMEATAVDGTTSLLATHHLEELPPSTTHAALLREGRFVASGPVGDVLTDAGLSECFRMPISVARRAGRWSAVAA